MKTRLALFTSQFPSKVSTFFARDLYTFICNGYEVDIFPIYPIFNKYWINVPEYLQDKIKVETNIKYISPFHLRWKNLTSDVAQDIRNIKKQSIGYGVFQLFKSALVIQQAISWARQFDGRYDYMLSYWGNYAGTYAYIANKLLNNKIPYSFFLHAGTDLYRDRIFLQEKILYANKIFTVCEFNRDFLQKIYPKAFNDFETKIVIHQLGIDFDDIQFNLNGRKTDTLLSIGSFIPQKGFSNLIQAISLLISEYNIKLILIGDGPEQENLKRLAKALKIDEQIKFTGWLPFDEVRKYLSECTILIHPSSELGDAVPTVIKEAMAAGLPVIAANIAGIPELLNYGNSGLLFPPKDFKALANSIRKLLNDHDFRNQLATKGRSYAENKFDLWKNGKLLAQHLEEDLHGKM